MGDLELSKNIFRQRIFTDEESVFTRKEVDKIVDYIDCHKESMINLGIKLVFETGLRAGELSALKAEDFDGNVITVRRTEIMYKDEMGHTDISTTKGFYYFDNREDSEAVKMIQNAIG